jgi:hypothetical protein
MYFETPKKNRKNRSISKPKPLIQQQNTSLEKKGQKEKENNYTNLKNGGVMNNLNSNSQNNSKIFLIFFKTLMDKQIKMEFILLIMGFI